MLDKLRQEDIDAMAERAGSYIDDMPGDNDLERVRGAFVALLGEAGNRVGPGVACLANAMAITTLCSMPATVSIVTDDRTLDAYDGLLGKHVRYVDGEVASDSSLSMTKH